jgi:hypothetical protein
MRKSNEKQAQLKSNPKIASAREREVISRIERLNEELTTAPESRKLYLRNQLRRLEAMVIDPVFSFAFDVSCEIKGRKEEAAMRRARRRGVLKIKFAG